MYAVLFSAYCGMSHEVDSCESREEAQALIRRRNAHFRKRGYSVSKIGHNTWEYQQGDDACMVSDDEGVLTVRRVRKPARRRYWR